MQWPYCHGYGTVENINQACTCNREKDGGRRDRKKTAMRETEGGRRGKEDNGTVYMCLCVRAWFYVCFDEYICKSHDFWASVCSCPKLGGEWIFDSFVKKIFLNEKKKKKPQCYHQNSPGSHLHREESQMWNELNSELISYRGELTFQLTEICFSSLAVFQVEFHVPKCLLILS